MICASNCLRSKVKQYSRQNNFVSYCSDLNGFWEFVGWECVKDPDKIFRLEKRQRIPPHVSASGAKQKALQQQGFLATGLTVGSRRRRCRRSCRPRGQSGARCGGRRRSRSCRRRRQCGTGRCDCRRDGRRNRHARRRRRRCGVGGCLQQQPAGESKHGQYTYVAHVQFLFLVTLNRCEQPFSIHLLQPGISFMPRVAQPNTGNLTIALHGARVLEWAGHLVSFRMRWPGKHRRGSRGGPS